MHVCVCVCEIERELPSFSPLIIHVKYTFKKKTPPEEPNEKCSSSHLSRMKDFYLSNISIFCSLQVVLRENVNDFLIYNPPTTQPSLDVYSGCRINVCVQLMAESFRSSKTKRRFSVFLPLGGAIGNAMLCEGLTFIRLLSPFCSLAPCWGQEVTETLGLPAVPAATTRRTIKQLCFTFLCVFVTSLLQRTKNKRCRAAETKARGFYSSLSAQLTVNQIPSNMWSLPGSRFWWTSIKYVSGDEQIGGADGQTFR